MNVSINGDMVDLPSGATVAVVVQRVRVPQGSDRGVAVALNGTVVPKSDWGTTSLGEGDKVEVLRAIGGGA